MEMRDDGSASRVAQRLVAALEEDGRRTGVQEVRIGLGYTAVLLEDQRTGVAFTFREEARRGCSVFDSLHPIYCRPASDLLALLDSEDRIEAGVGLACANALANRPCNQLREGDILGHLDLTPDDDVGMVGHFRPLVAELKKAARSLTVFEQVKEPQADIRPAEEAEEGLRQCHVALITATSIINHTIDTMLEAAKQCRQIVVLGASTPMLPAAFGNTNVTLLSGVIVERPGEVMRVVSEGGGMGFFRPHIRKVNLPVHADLVAST